MTIMRLRGKRCDIMSIVYAGSHSGSVHIFYCCSVGTPNDTTTWWKCSISKIWRSWFVFSAIHSITGKFESRKKKTNTFFSHSILSPKQIELFEKFKASFYRVDHVPNERPDFHWTWHDTHNFCAKSLIDYY